MIQDKITESFCYKFSFTLLCTRIERIFHVYNVFRSVGSKGPGTGTGSGCVIHIEKLWIRIDIYSLWFKEPDGEGDGTRVTGVLVRVPGAGWADATGHQYSDYRELSWRNPGGSGNRAYPIPARVIRTTRLRTLAPSYMHPRPPSSMTRHA